MLFRNIFRCENFFGAAILNQETPALDNLFLFGYG
jgi:hypothetical protein